MLVFLFAMYYVVISFYLRNKIREIKTKEEKMIDRMKWMCKLTLDSDAACISELRMDRATFRILCDMVTEIGALKPTKNTSVEEVVAMFIYTLADHHKKCRIIGLLFSRSTETVSRQFHQILIAVLRLHHILLKKPVLITQDCQDERWKKFQMFYIFLFWNLIYFLYFLQEMAATIPARGRGKNKQFWKDEEVEALVDTLQELAADPYWKVDGGFKNNYMVEVHKMMATKVPNFDKEVDPYINSKIKWLREKYNQISEMLMQSGCQWDDVEQKINCEKQWFDDWCLNHKNVVGLWNFRFPYLHKLDMVWGRDRATGHKAEDIADVGSNANYQKNTIVCSSSDSDGEPAMFSNAQGSHAIPTSTRAPKKRKKVSPERETIHKKKNQQHISKKSIQVMESKSESLTDEKMQEVITELIALGLSPTDIGRAAEVCCNDPAKVQVMFALPSYLRCSFVLGFLYPSPNP
ncbi:hypothetical protein ACS0TY_022403 [Phlomoides rotata]